MNTECIEDRNAISGLLLELANFKMRTGRKEEALDILIKLMSSKEINTTYVNPDVINFIIRYLLLPVTNNDYAEDNFKNRINRLTHFMSLVLGFELDANILSPGIINIEQSRIKIFESIVKYTLVCIKYCFSLGDEPQPDLCKIENYMTSHSTHDVNLGVNSWASLTRVVGLYSDDFFENNLVQSLRFVSILFEVNQNWSTLFINLSTQQLIPVSVFEIVELKLFVRNITACQIMHDCYPFLFSSYIRTEGFKFVIQTLRPSPVDENKRIVFSLCREEVLKNLSECFELSGSKLDRFAFWDFTFENEMGMGPGPNKELYTLLSSEIARYDLDLWIGEPLRSTNGIEYVDSSCGFFPSPSLDVNKRTQNILETIGVMMAKSQLDGYYMDLNFSKALYKCMQLQQTDLQCLKLSDIKHVMPSLTGFVNGLLDIVKVTHLINITTDLTPEQKSEKISNLKYDGCRLEDLCINFTVPGYPDIEMVQGGTDIALTPCNALEYLNLLVWWLLYKGPQAKLNYLRKGFESVIPLSCFNLLCLDDMDEVFCGMTSEKWTVKELEDNCSYEDFNSTLHFVDKLFEILISFSKVEREKFLKFVTGCQRLPAGGLASLDPPLTISYKKHEYNSDLCLPSAMTCSNTLFITDYSSSEIMREKLLYAITEGANTFQFL